MNRLARASGISVVASTLVVGLGEVRDAAACGGCFHPPTQNVSDITDERMLLSVSPTQTTLYDQIEYAGNPASFAWVLPIHGTVSVGLSADVLFDSVDELTTTQIVPPVLSCPGPPSSCQSSGCASESALSSPSGFANTSGPTGGVTVTKQQNVGPYETVQLSATDASALNTWLSQNGFSIPADVTPIIDAYVAEGFNFLAMKLLPDEGVQAMRPVRVTMPGASLSLPLRMAAVGTGATVGITIWVVSDGRYEPQNFPFFHVDDSQIVWDFNTSSSNYTTLRAQNETALSGKGWEIESSIDLNTQLITSVILGGGVYFAGGGVGSSPPSSAGDDYLPIGASGVSDDGGTDDSGAAESADQVRADDVAALFAGMSGSSVRVTRMRSDIAHAAMTTDFVLQASADQSELSNVRSVTQSVNGTCPVYNSDCDVVGNAPVADAIVQAQVTRDHSGSCVTSSKGSREPAVSFAALAGAVGLVGVRFARSRRRRARTRTER